MTSVAVSREAAVAELMSSFAPDVVVNDEARLHKYRFDRAQDPSAGYPLAAVRAESTADVQTTLAWATRHRIPVILRGAGTGLSGGSTARSDAIVLSTERMRSIAVDPLMRTAVVQPGLLNREVKQAAAAHGLWYPPDPSSFEICSIGGNVATNAGGLCCVKYGVTSDYVLGLEVVLADGSALCLGGPRLKDSAGLPLTKLFVGSEGILGVITEVTLKLLPPQAAPATAVATFASTAAATAAILAITASLRPAMLEYMDAVAIHAVEDWLSMGLDRSAAAMIVAQTDAESGAGQRELDAMVAAFTANGASEVFATREKDEGDVFVSARRQAIPAVERLGRLLLEDVGVPLTKLPDLVAGVARIASRRSVKIALIAHAGDGNTHPLIVFDPSDPELTRSAQTAFGEVMDLAIDLGGTITGEHGVGRLKKPWLQKQVGDQVIEMTRRVKASFDPLNLLNPDVIL